jgi:hypothetical protein
MQIFESDDKTPAKAAIGTWPPPIAIDSCEPDATLTMTDVATYKNNSTANRYLGALR